jgi:diguanylate cyclase (GGDEF)-like protein
MPGTSSNNGLVDSSQLERVRIFFGHAANNLASLAIGGVVVAAVLQWAGISAQWLIGWSVLLAVAMLAMWLLERHVAQVGLTEHNCRRLLRWRIAMGAGITLIYGLAVFLIPTVGSYAEHTFLFLIMSTVVTTVALGYSVMPSYYLTVNLCCLAPITVRFIYLYLRDDNDYFLLMTVSSILWQGLVLKKARMVSATVIGSIALNQRLQREIGEHLRTREALNHMAMHDALTGLANRRYFEQTFERTLSQAAREQTCFGLLSIDLNDFKPVNDTYGHATGDQLLQTVAERLRKSTRSSDLCARVGGDEFAVLCIGVKTPADLGDITEKLKEELGKTFEPLGTRVHTSASIGGALYPTDGNNLTRLMACADERMYADKQAAKASRLALH